MPLVHSILYWRCTRRIQFASSVTVLHKIAHMFFFCSRRICTTAYMKFDKKNQFTDGPICPKIAAFGPPKTGTRLVFSTKPYQFFFWVGCTIFHEMREKQRMQGQLTWWEGHFSRNSWMEAKKQPDSCVTTKRYNNVVYLDLVEYFCLVLLLVIFSPMQFLLKIKFNRPTKL